jgi:primosomal replication protein N
MPCGCADFVTVTVLQHEEMLTDLPPQRLTKFWPVLVHSGESAECKVENIMAGPNVYVSGFSDV